MKPKVQNPAHQLGTTLPKRTKGIKRSAIKQSGKPIAKRGKQKAKREARNRAYYASPEWRAKKKATHERDGYQCVEMTPIYAFDVSRGRPTRVVGEWRCPNRGEIVNGKQTSRGLVCEETSYGHRGIPGRIDTCKTRCKDHDRYFTPLERINHAYGFSRSSRSRAGER